MRGNACHCRTCCMTFSGISAFDQHIVRGVHQAPQMRGLVITRREVWGWPDSGRRNKLPGQTAAA
jgi:hypothetical protein